MAFDYEGLALTAQQLIADAGREVTFTLRGRSPADSNKPWRGPSMVAVDPEDPDADEPTLIEDILAAIVPIEFADEARTLVKRPPMATLYVAALSFDPTLDVKTLDTVDDGLWTWRITSVQPVMPGVTPVIYQMELVG